jgi:hypothetical protein
MCPLSRRFDCPDFPPSAPENRADKAPRLRTPMCVPHSAPALSPAPLRLPPNSPSARSVPLQLRVGRSVQDENHTSICWNHGGRVNCPLNEINPSKCPLCGQSNHCTLVHGEQDCWCRHVQIPVRHLMQIPLTHIGKACICQKCARAPLQAEPSQTIKRGGPLLD